MNSAERIRAVLEGHAPDRVPIHHISFSSRVASRILGRPAFVGGGINQWREAVALWNGPDAHTEFAARTLNDSIDLAIATGQDLVRPGYWRDGEKPAAKINEYTFRYESGDGSRWAVKRLDPRTEVYNTIAQSGSRETEIEDLDQETEKRERRAQEYAPTKTDFPDIRYALDRVDGKMEVRASVLQTVVPYDRPEWLEATILRPDLVGRLLDAQVLESIKNARVLAGMSARMLFGGGDFASDAGPIYSPFVFSDLVLPRLVRISEECRKLGVYHFFGSDGNVWPVAESLYGRSGIHGHFELDRRAGMDIPRIHERYPRLVMIGNISSHTMHTGTPAEVEAETRACLEEARKTGRVLAGCSNIVVSETPDENVDALLNTISRYR